jgi:hypothetical protein
VKDDDGHPGQQGGGLGKKNLKKGAEEEKNLWSLTQTRTLDLSRLVYVGLST